MPKIREFTITEQHLMLLQGLYIDAGEFDLPEVDCKRPFGNSNVICDIAEKIGLSKIETNDEEWVWPKGTTEACRAATEGLYIAMQICLSTQSFEVGTYYCDDEYDQKSWKLIPPKKKRK